jgi:ribonuclease BN (tRNA processing enzyme)
MKKLILTLALIGAVMTAQAQSKSVKALYEKYKSKDDFFHLELGGNFMNFAEGFKIDLDENDMATVAKSIEKLNFFTLPDNSDQSKAEYKALQKGLEKERYELLMETSEAKSGIVVYSKGDAKISDLVVLVSGEEGDLMVFEMKGTFDQETIAKATKYKGKN